jgi:nucleoside phosphorylase
VAFAYHKVGFCKYLMKSYSDSIEFQKTSLHILTIEQEKIEVEKLKCKIYFCLGLNQQALKRYEAAKCSYKIALDNACKCEMQDEEAEIVINLSSLAREEFSLNNESSSVKIIEETLKDLYYAVRIIDKNPYLKAIGLKEIANLYETIDLDIARKYVEKAYDVSYAYDLPFTRELQDDLDRIIRKMQDLLEQDYILDDQDWYSKDYPKTQEIDKEGLELLSFDADFVIITATLIELKAVLRLLAPCAKETFPFRNHTRWGIYYLGRFGNYKTIVTQCRMGTRDERGAGFVTQKALEIWKPKAVIMVGIAFGKSPADQTIGDVLVATEIIDYDVHRIGLDGIIDRGSRPPSSRNLLELFEQAHEWKFSRPNGSLCKHISGPILSGDKLVDNPEFKADLFRRFPHAKGGEMEGVGLCSAANSLQTPWILIKAICDWADGNKKDNKDKYQALAAASAVDLVHYVLSQKTILDCL